MYGAIPPGALVRAWPRTSGLASAIKLPSSSTVELYGRAPPHSQLRRVREKLAPGLAAPRVDVAAVPRGLLILQRRLLSLALTLPSARRAARCSCVSRRRASPPTCLRVRLRRRTESGAMGQGRGLQGLGFGLGPGPQGVSYGYGYG